MRASLSRIFSSKGEKFTYGLPVCLPHKPSPTGPPENGGEFKHPSFVFTTEVSRKWRKTQPPPFSELL